MLLKISALCVLASAALAMVAHQQPLSLAPQSTASSESRARSLRELSAWQALEITSDFKSIGHSFYQTDTYLLYEDSSRTNTKSHTSWVVAFEGGRKTLSAAQRIGDEAVDAPITFVGKEGKFSFYEIPVVDTAPKPALVTVKSEVHPPPGQADDEDDSTIIWSKRHSLSGDLLEIIEGFSQEDKAALQDLVLTYSSPPNKIVEYKVPASLFTATISQDGQAVTYTKIIPGDYREGLEAEMKVTFSSE